MNLKEINGWIDKSFTELLQLLKNTLPNRNYEAKKMLNLVMFNVLKNPNPLKDVEASALLDLVVLV